MQARRAYAWFSRRGGAVLALLVFLALLVGHAAAQDSGEDSVIMERYRKALELDPESEYVNYRMAIAHLREKNYHEALQHLGIVAQHRPEDPEVNTYLGLAYAGTGELGMAAEAYERAVRSPAAAKEKLDLDKAFYNLGIAHLNNDDLDGAMRAFTRSVDISPAQGMSYCRMGEIFLETRRYDDALDNFKVCDARSRGDDRVRRHIISARLARGIYLLGAKREDEALADFMAARALDGSNETALYFVGYLLYQKEEYQRAFDVVKAIGVPESRDIFDGLVPLVQNIGVEFLAANDLDRAAAVFGHAVTLKKKDADLHYLLGVTLMKKGDYERASSEIGEVLKIKPSHAKANLISAVLAENAVERLVKRGEEELSARNYAEALGAFNAALEKDPGSQRAVKGKRSVQGAIDALRIEVSRKRDEEIGARLAGAGKHLIEGRYKDALALYRYVLTLDASNEEASRGVDAARGFMAEKKSGHVRAAERYGMDNRASLAIREYRLALEYDPEDESVRKKLSEAERNVSALVAPLMSKAADDERNERLTEAVRAYGEALRHDPDNADAAAGRKRAVKALENQILKRIARGDELLENGDHFRAAEAFRGAAGLREMGADFEPEFVALGGLKGKSAVRLKAAEKAMEQGRLSEAAAEYEGARAIDPRNKDVSSGIAAVEETIAGEIAAKIRLADEAYAKGMYKQAGQLAGEVLALDRDNPEAGAIKDGARQKREKSSESLLKKGVEAYGSGDMEGARAEFKKVLGLDAANQTARKYLAMIEAQGRPKPSGGNAEKLYLAGIELYTEGRYVDAIRSWEEVLRLDPGHEKARRNIGKAKRKLEGVMDVKD